MSNLLEQLNTALEKFNAKRVNDITDVYAYHPDFQASRLGAGSYGEAFRMRSVTNSGEPIRVVKAIPKERVSRNALQIQHLAAELAVTGFFTHQNLNKRVGLYHNAGHIYLVLELVAGTTPDAKSRLLYLFAHNHPRRIADFEAFVEQLEKDAAMGGFPSLDDYLDRSGRMRTILAECGVKREVPTSTDLFGLIVAMKRVPDGLSKIINRQALQGLQHLHENGVVHRDIKTENVVVGIERRCQLLYYDEGPAMGQVRGVRICETVHAKLIDFGLVKYMRLSNAPNANMMSPGAYDPEKNPATSLHGLAAGADLGFDSDEDAAGNETKPAALPPGNFPVMVTPCGTELYCSLEVIDGILRSGVGRTKWMSDSAHLPKMDVYGVGTMMFCCANGRPPFRPPRDPYRQNVSREDRIKQVQRLVQLGPTFASTVVQDTKDFIMYLMCNDPERRPSVWEALRHPFLATDSANSFTYDVSLDGTVCNVTVDPKHMHAPVTTHVSAVAVRPDDDDDDAYGDGDDDDIVAAAVRGKEDNGDTTGKGDAEPPHAAL